MNVKRKSDVQVEPGTWKNGWICERHKRFCEGELQVRQEQLIFHEVQKLGVNYGTLAITTYVDTFAHVCPRSCTYCLAAMSRFIHRHAQINGCTTAHPFITCGSLIFYLRTY